MKNLIEHNGTFFAEGTNEQIMNIVNIYVGRKTERLRVYYGDATTGKSWHEENDVCGYIGRSAGTQKIALLIANKHSMGGGALLTDCIIKIVRISNKTVLYVHPTFNQDTFFNSGAMVIHSYIQDGTIIELTYANCKSEQSAQRLADFMNGKRNSK